MRPLYEEFASTKVEWQGGNAGLWYDKFCDTWLPSGEGLGDDGKKQWINTVTGKPCSEDKQLAEARARMERLLEAQNQSPLFYRLESDFVTGLGREHPVENGFAWHHTLGTPYLPGSSVKGMVRAWAEVWVDAEIKDIRRIFGPSAEDIRENDDVQAGVGSIIFLDALPITSVQLKADIMTPHYTDYYEGKSPPADWLSPNPIPFLVVEAGASFMFGILPRRNDERSRDDCSRVRVWLKDALCWTGAGAKTAVGYGRFTVDEETKKKAEQEREVRELKQKEHEAEVQRQNELARMSPTLRKLHEDGFETSEFVGQPMQKWLTQMQQAVGEEKLEIAQHLKAWYQQHRAEQWSKPNKKNAEKIAPIKEVLGEK